MLPLISGHRSGCIHPDDEVIPANLEPEVVRALVHVLLGAGFRSDAIHLFHFGKTLGLYQVTAALKGLFTRKLFMVSSDDVLVRCLSWV
jgi:hypothetical protein